MKNTMKIQDLLVKKEALVKLFNSQDLPIKVSYRLSKMQSVIEKEYEYIENARIKLVNKYGKKDEDGLVKVEKDDKKAQEAFTNDYLDLLKEEITIETEPLAIDELGDAIKLSPVEINLLSGLIFKADEPKEEPKEEAKEPEKKEA